MFRDGLEGVQQRGKAQLNDKTMIDALQPAVEALEAAVAAGDDIDAALRSRRGRALKSGMKHTAEPCRPAKGAPAIWVHAAVGHQDPGATSTFYSDSIRRPGFGRRRTADRRRSRIACARPTEPWGRD